jgi:hypothetical protein
MELPFEVTERIIWGAWGLLSFIVLIIWLPWEGEKKDKPLKVPKERERQAEND